MHAMQWGSRKQRVERGGGAAKARARVKCITKKTEAAAAAAAAEDWKCASVGAAGTRGCIHGVWMQQQRWRDDTQPWAALAAVFGLNPATRALHGEGRSFSPCIREL